MAGGSSQLSRSFWAHVTKAPFMGSFTALQQESPGAVRGPDRLLTSNRSVRVMLRRGFSPNCPVTALPVLITTLILFVTHFQTIQEKENGKVGLERTPSLITPSHCVLYINLLKLRLTPAGVTFISLLFYLPGGSSTSLRA